MKLALLLAILAVAEGLDITVEDAVSVEDTTFFLVKELTSEDVHPTDVEGSRSVSWEDKNDMDIDRDLNVFRDRKPSKKPTSKPTRRPTTKSPTKSLKKPTKKPSKAAKPTSAPTEAPTAAPTAAPTTAAPVVQPTNAPVRPPPAQTPVEPPTESPVTPPSTCFPGDAIVEVEGQGKVRMRDVKIGDRVLGMGGQFHPIYAFVHWSIEPSPEYIRVYTNATSAPLEISSRHFVFLFDQQDVPAVPAFLKVGDVLLGADPTRDALEIIKIDTVMKKGFYAPLTADGTIVVNGVVASSYALPLSHSFDDRHDYVYLFGKHKIMPINAFSHVRNSPLRLASLGISPWFGTLGDKEARNFLSCAYRQTDLWMRSSTHGVVVVAAGTVLFFSLCGFAFFCYLIECIVGPVMGPTVIALVILASMMAFKKQRKTKAAGGFVKVKIH